MPEETSWPAAALQRLAELVRRRQGTLNVLLAALVVTLILGILVTKSAPPTADGKLAEESRDRIAKTGEQPPNGGLFDPQTLVKWIEPAIVRIDSDRGVGTGFLVENASTVITNFHVIQGANAASVTFRDGTKERLVGALAVSPEADLIALLLATRQSHSPLRVASVLPEKGEKVVAFGTPEGLSFSATEGIVSSMRTGRELKDTFQASCGIDVFQVAGLSLDTTWVQSTAPISHGNSGGPLVNMRGEVVGVNTLIHIQGQNLNFAVSATEVKRLLELTKRPSIPLALLPKPTILPEPNILGAERDAMKGLLGVLVVVDAVPEPAARWGLGQTEVQSLVERQLRTAGVKILTASDLPGPVGTLHVSTNVLASDTMPMLFYIFECRLGRLVALNPYANDKIDVTCAPVWTARSQFGYAGQQVFREAMRKGLETVLSQFSDAFLAVNGKPTDR